MNSFDTSITGLFVAEAQWRAHSPRTRPGSSLAHRLATTGLLAGEGPVRIAERALFLLIFAGVFFMGLSFLLGLT